VDDYTVTCARCGHDLHVSQAAAEEGDEWECLPCNKAHNELDRLRRELAEAQRERDERMRWIRELWEACEVNGCLPDSGVAEEIKAAMIADAAMPAP
jgi:formylmethanofuran dehydrogenase subunit E